MSRPTIREHLSIFIINATGSSQQTEETSSKTLFGFAPKISRARWYTCCPVTRLRSEEKAQRFPVIPPLTLAPGFHDRNDINRSSFRHGKFAISMSFS
jgi:hypothetical protein